MLLDLPPEILEMILLALPPDSFAVMLMTSKSIRSAILSTTKVLRTQLRNVPGLRATQPYSIEDLLDLFNRRAALGAWNGVAAFGDVIVHKATVPKYSDERWTRPRFNWIQSCCGAKQGCERGLLATAADEQGVIHVYRIRKGRIFPLCKLDPKTMGLDVENGKPSDRIQYRCVAMRWQRCNNTHLDHLVALFSYSLRTYGNRTKGKFASSFVAEATEKAEQTYFLTGWKFCKDTNQPWFRHEVQCAAGYEPKLLVTTEDYSKDYHCYPIAIIFEGESTPTVPLYKISVYQVTHSKTTHVPVKGVEIDGVEAPGHMFQQVIRKARFTRGPHPELWLYGWDTAPMENVTGCVTPGITALRLASTVSTRNSTPKLFSSKASPKCFKGIPIKARHEHEAGIYENGSKYCMQTAIELIVPRSAKHKGAFLVKYAEEQDTCAPFDLSLELPALEYTVVAKLLGSEMNTSSPMGPVIALSPNCNWVAIASWRTIKVWGIHTESFLVPARGSLDPESMKEDAEGSQAVKQNRARKHEFMVADDKAYTSHCGQGYFHDHIRVKGKEGKRIVGIQPLELPSRGVVFSMAWAKHNILWAWTDQGLVKWAWHKKRSGLKETVDLHRVPDNIWSYG